GRARGIGQERREWLQDATAVRPVRKGEHERVLRFEAGGRRLKHLQQPLIEERNTRGWRRATRRFGLARRHEREMRGLTREAERLQSLRAVALGHGVGNV